MPVFHFTYHSYRSWMPGRDEGFTQKRRGKQLRNDCLAIAYEVAAKWPPFVFDDSIQRFLCETTIDICRRRNWRPHGLATESTHLHAVVSWRDETRWEVVRGRIRNILSLELSKRFDQKGRPWLAEESSRRQVKDEEHFVYLMREYLPGHSGWKWFEDRGFVK